MNYNESLSNSKITKNIKNNFIYGKLDISISFDIILEKILETFILLI